MGVRLAAYALAGLVVTIALAWFPEVIPWSLRPGQGGVAWVEERGGLYWCVTLRPRDASAIGYESEAKAQRALAQRALARLLAGGMIKAAEAGPPPLPEWARFREPVITKEMMTPGLGNLGGAASGDACTGWPFAALRGGSAEYMGPGYTWTRVRSDHILNLGGREVPTRPLWAGLLGNTAIFAVVAWGVHATAAAVVRRVRARLRPGPGMCPRCGYDRRGLAVDAACPECGG